jgi:hypothetical protein
MQREEGAKGNNGTRYRLPSNLILLFSVFSSLCLCVSVVQLLISDALVRVDEPFFPGLADGFIHGR